MKASAIFPRPSKNSSARLPLAAWAGANESAGKGFSASPEPGLWGLELDIVKK
jgi:hypothetical protein